LIYFEIQQESRFLVKKFHRSRNVLLVLSGCSTSVRPRGL
jgi:hypothetical protein